MSSEKTGFSLLYVTVTENLIVFNELDKVDRHAKNL